MNKNETVTKGYLDERFEFWTTDIKQHMTDLASGFNERLKGVCDQVMSVDEKVTRIDQRVASMDSKLTSVQMDVFHIKGVLKEKTDKKDTLSLRKRIISLEHKTA